MLSYRREAVMSDRFIDWIPYLVSGVVALVLLYLALFTKPEKGTAR